MSQAPAAAVARPGARPPVPFACLWRVNEEARESIDAAIRRVLDSGRYILGAEVEAFESEWAAFVGAAGCVGVGNGLDALTLALRAMGVGPGDEVIVPGNTYIATWLAVTQTGARPVPVDADSRTANLDPDLLEAAITSRTRVLLPVHLYGRAAPMDRVLQVARRHGLRVLEDAAQAHGATFGGRRVGSIGDATAWSFYPSKNLGALGDAGAVTSDDPDLLGQVRALGNYGSSVRNHHDVIGANSRLDDMQAAVLRAKLPHLVDWNRRRAVVAAAYLGGLADLASRGLVLPAPPRPASSSEHVWHQFVVRHSRRDEIRAALAAAGVETLIHYPVPPHLQPAYKDLGIEKGSMPVSEAIAAEVFSLPIGPELTSDQVGLVARALRDAVLGRP